VINAGGSQSKVSGIRLPLLAAGMVFVLSAAAVGAQELVPASYTPAPNGVNLVTVNVFYNSGDLSFAPTVPIEDGSAEITTTSLGYARTFSLFKRSANVTVILPLVEGSLEGIYLGEQAYADRRGAGDLNLRLAANLFGAPAMSPQEFALYKPKTNVGASLIVRAPTGQYDPSRLINIGTNRWSFKPEIGFVHVMGKWVIDGYVGAWFFTTNSDFFGGSTRKQDPILSTQFHLRYIFRPRLWVAVDANFWRGGQTTIDGNVSDDLQKNSRVGLTLSWKLTKHHAVRFAVSRGAFTRIGGDFDSVGVAYSYSWMRKPKS